MINFSCSKCGREYPMPVNWEGPFKNVIKHLEQIQQDVDCCCECREEETNDE